MTWLHTKVGCSSREPNMTKAFFKAKQNKANFNLKNEK